MQKHLVDTWLHRPRPEANPHMRLFCFPYVGGGGVVYHKWPEDLPKEVEVCAIRLPGRETRFREPPFTRLIPLVEELAYILQTLLDKPFAFFGHSLGSVVGFELIRYLRRNSLPTPVHLFVSGAPLPHLLYPGTPHITFIGHELKQRITYHRSIDIDLVRNELQKYGGIPDEILQEPELMQLFLPMLCADIEMFLTYSYTEEKPLDCRITSFGGLMDPMIGYDHITGWHIHTNSDFNFHMLPGGHFFIQTRRQELIQLISRELSHSLNIHR